MTLFRVVLFFLFWSAGYVFSDVIDTFYGKVEVNEPVVIELINAPAFQRLKGVYQYGVSYYLGTHKEPYNRFDHSIGVFWILREKGASLKEQIAGLLHDVSHTAFSHVSDWVFPVKKKGDDYHSTQHGRYLQDTGLATILTKHGFSVQDISPDNQEFKMLEQPLPDLCADRIDYNLQGAYYQNKITKEEVEKTLKNISFEKGEWVLHDKDLALKLADFSIFMTKDCWGNVDNHLASRVLADAILKAFDIGVITKNEFHFGGDQKIWDALKSSQDVFIKESMARLMTQNFNFKSVDLSQATDYVQFKCRSIDPWVSYKGVKKRLSAIDEQYRYKLDEIRRLSATGWPVKKI